MAHFLSAFAQALLLPGSSLRVASAMAMLPGSCLRVSMLPGSCLRLLAAWAMAAVPGTSLRLAAATVSQEQCLRLRTAALPRLPRPAASVVVAPPAVAVAAGQARPPKDRPAAATVAAVAAVVAALRRPAPLPRPGSMN